MTALRTFADALRERQEAPRTQVDGYGFGILSSGPADLPGVDEVEIIHTNVPVSPVSPTVRCPRCRYERAADMLIDAGGGRWMCSSCFDAQGRANEARAEGRKVLGPDKVIVTGPA